MIGFPPRKKLKKDSNHQSILAGGFLMSIFRRKIDVKVNILGVKYKVKISTEKEEPKLKKCDGYMDHSTKKIVIGKFQPSIDSIDDLKSYTKKVMRHEIIHAFLYESGLWNNSGNVEAWGQSEEMTDWIAIQSPKFFKAFSEAGCL